MEIIRSEVQPGTLTREELNAALETCKKFKVWIQLGPTWEIALDITKEQAGSLGGGVLDAGHLL